MQTLSVPVFGASYNAYDELRQAASSRHMAVADRLFEEFNLLEDIEARRCILQNLPADPEEGISSLTPGGQPLKVSHAFPLLLMIRVRCVGRFLKTALISNSGRYVSPPTRVASCGAGGWFKGSQSSCCELSYRAATATYQVARVVARG